MDRPRDRDYIHAYCQSSIIGYTIGVVYRMHGLVKTINDILNEWINAWNSLKNLIRNEWMNAWINWNNVIRNEWMN